VSPNFDVNSYIDVNDRILRFWQEFPLGRIETDLMSAPDDFTQCRYTARVYRHIEDLAPAATGWAFEIAGGAGANRTSHEENCETSAIGRALANMGYATSAKDRPSRQEMEKVNRGTASLPSTDKVASRRVDQRTGAIEDDAPVMANDGQVQAIERFWNELGRDAEGLSKYLFEQYAQENARALTQEQAGQEIVKLGKERNVERAMATA
jgi:hypothetical protein